MLSLLRKEFPSSKGDVAHALDQALRRFVQKPGPLVDLRSRVFPCIDEIAINIDGARFDSPLPPLAKTEGETNLAFEASMVTLSGRNISVRGIPLDLRLEMRDVVFHKGEDGNGQAVLVLQKARDGHAVVSAAQLALEEAIAKIGGREARRRGIHIEQVRLSMRARGQRSLAADVRVQARKFLFRAKVDIYGQLDIDDEFVGKIADLKCKGDGAIGSLACGALEPFFRQLSAKSFPLKSLPLGEIQLRDLHVAVADTVEVTIDFGSVSS
jgi:hypothetical protein